MSGLFDFWLRHRAELGALVAQHLMLVAVSTAAAIAVAVPAGIAAARRPRAGRVVLLIANIGQTIPSLALLGFLIPLAGIGPRTALVALTIYALLPIVRNTVTGIRGVDAAVIYAATALGMSSRQRLWLVELPLAMPSIVAGVRVAAVIGVGTAAIAAAIGAGGLGEYIFRGLAMVDATTIMAGALPAAGIALAIDGALAGVERLIAARRVRPRTLALASGAAVLALFAALWAGTRAEVPAVTVGSKNFTESIVLGELLAQAIEDEGLAVSRTFNLGGTFICDQALRAGGIDLYPEYTGTAVTAILNQPAPTSSEAALALTREGYAPAGITAGPPFGFNNTFAILVRRADAEAFGLARIDDLAKVVARFRPGFGQEFLQRADGFPALVERYGLRFAQAPRGMELSLIYQALASGQVDVIAGDATSALIDALDLVVLDDARHFFPPYDALPLVRTPALQAHPEIGRALDRLAGAIDAAAMRAMNRAVDIDHESPAVVARRFLSAAPAK